MGIESPGKVSQRLQAELETLSAGDSIEVVIALAPPDLAVVSSSSAGERGAVIAGLKLGFEERVRSLDDRLASLGGEVIESAWINSTVLGRVPAEQVGDIAEDVAIQAIDLPTRLEPDIPL